MNTHARKANLLALLSLLVVLLISGLAACGGPDAAQPQTTSPQPSALSVATTYFQVFNAGMRSGDFSALASVYAPDATLTQSSTKGVTTVVHGLADITRFYQGLKTRLAGYQWTTESMRSVAPNVVLAYEHAGSPPLHVASRCIHMFVIQNGKITSYDWAGYYAGQP
jgi:ketosteroid isomerase-like protein